MSNRIRAAAWRRPALAIAGALCALLVPAASASAHARTRTAADPVAAAKKLCLGIPRSAATALYKDAFRGPLAGTGGATCQFQPTAGKGVPSGTFFVVLGVNDFGALWVLNSRGAHRFAGLGDKAAWSQAQVGMSAPTLIAQKGDVGCEVTSNGWLDHTSMRYARSGGNPVIGPTAALAFARKLGAICKAVWSGK